MSMKIYDNRYNELSIKPGRVCGYLLMVHAGEILNSIRCYGGEIENSGCR
jgi:hypothetical protein